MVKNQPSNAGDSGSIPGGELRSHMCTSQLERNPCASTAEPVCSRSCAPQLEKPPISPTKTLQSPLPQKRYSVDFPLKKYTDMCAVLSFLFIAWTGLSFSWAQKLNEMHPLQIFLSSATLAGWNQELWKERLQASSLAHGRLRLRACLDCQELCHWRSAKVWPQDAFVYQWLLESCVWED